MFGRPPPPQQGPSATACRKTRRRAPTPPGDRSPPQVLQPEPHLDRLVEDTAARGSSSTSRLATSHNSIAGLGHDRRVAFELTRAMRPGPRAARRDARPRPPRVTPRRSPSAATRGAAVLAAPPATLGGRLHRGRTPGRRAIVVAMVIATRVRG